MRVVLGHVDVVTGLFGGDGVLGLALLGDTLLRALLLLELGAVQRGVQLGVPLHPGVLAILGCLVVRLHGQTVCPTGRENTIGQRTGGRGTEKSGSQKIRKKMKSSR